MLDTSYKIGRLQSKRLQILSDSEEARGKGSMVDKTRLTCKGRVIGSTMDGSCLCLVTQVSGGMQPPLRCLRALEVGGVRHPKRVSPPPPPPPPPHITSNYSKTFPPSSGALLFPPLASPESHSQATSPPVRTLMIPRGPTVEDGHASCQAQLTSPRTVASGRAAAEGL